MDKKSEQLGMAFGTACGRLDRRVLFWLVQKAGLDLCFRCGKRIEQVEDLSTEHKRPWQDVDPALFWDLGNIAFSHKRCNTIARRNVNIAPPGKSWCSGHKDFLDVTLFDQNPKAATGCRDYCKQCRRKKDLTGRYKSPPVIGA